jgi:hypothetical protein
MILKAKIKVNVKIKIIEYCVDSCQTRAMNLKAKIKVKVKIKNSRGLC